MKAARVALVILGFGLAGLGLVMLRAEQTRSSARALALEMEWMALRRESWSTQVGLARLRAPGSIHDRSKWFQTDLVAPSAPSDLRRGERLAERH